MKQEQSLFASLIASQNMVQLLGDSRFIPSSSREDLT